MALVQVSISARLPPTPRRRRRSLSISSSPRAGWPRRRVVGLQLGCHAPGDLLSELGGPVAPDISSLMQNAPLYQGFFTEHLGHAGKGVTPLA
ncbi:MAG TPA: hypothetical protein VFN61_11150 [Acidimicrobiales bacterium]|nr:hypothetical protein [Acidimicrobiales bacterium]